MVFAIGRQMILHTSPRWTLAQHQELKPGNEVLGDLDCRPPATLSWVRYGCGIVTASWPNCA